VLSIGKGLGASVLIVVDDASQPLPPGEKGELCLAGPQLTPGYWNDPERTRQVMFTIAHNGKPTRFYRTGDVCSIDAEGDALYAGRLDHQTKIQGYRVELGEIEHHARVFLQKQNAVALAVKNDAGNNEVALVIEGEASDTKPLLAHLKARLPSYMLPT